MSVGRAPDLGRDGVSGASYNDGWLPGNGGEWTKIEGGRWEERRREEQRNRKDRGEEAGVIAALVGLSLLWHTSVHQEGCVLQQRPSGRESGGKRWTSKGAVQSTEVEESMNEWESEIEMGIGERERGERWKLGMVEQDGEMGKSAIRWGNKLALAESRAVACNYCRKTLGWGSGQTLKATLSERWEKERQLRPRWSIIPGENSPLELSQWQLLRWCRTP